MPFPEPPAAHVPFPEHLATHAPFPEHPATHAPFPEHPAAQTPSPEHPAAHTPFPASDPSPVFVDSSGRRQRRVRRLGWLLVVPAVGYVVLLLSSLFGGPTLSSPLLPLPHPSQAPDSAQSKAPTASPKPGSGAAPKRTGGAAHGAA
ncbi:hypothetical protein ABZY57_18435, partial [Streptomyces sp. NPDC006450]